MLGWPVWKFLLYGAAVVGLLAVFALYTRPEFLVTLANQVWGCF
ncbi:MAG: hypothetical protein RIS34_674 [Pseudomonadota bacterium]|jgi:hypothetical protein